MAFVEAAGGGVDLEGPQGEAAGAAFLGEGDEAVAEALAAPVGGEVELLQLVAVEHQEADGVLPVEGAPGLAPGDEVGEPAAYRLVPVGPADRRQGGGEGAQPDLGEGGGVGGQGTAQEYGRSAGTGVGGVGAHGGGLSHRGWADAAPFPLAGVRGRGVDRDRKAVQGAGQRTCPNVH
ncbi:hypothetical protein Sdia_21360 [Streptomyces diastaticus subsp. diastaticus]|uniref:Uncharacterized protein n=1 Tax=Streptomyces diastaticus subsp. diastaticus TaxID=68040 RepID=A0ABQ1CMJ6_STRDI|nr:hypothetical protein Sdia_21360 [Streptomyces diastaticus subsp. diastaticus]GGU11937.1 hypothetical protein GCM10015534_12920 [Streptomyces diastaticus subsp. diastaticus]